VQKLTRAISLTAQIFFAGGAGEVYSAISRMPILRDAGAAQSLLSQRLRPSEIEMMAFHPQGTCRMGEDARAAVTNSVGEYHGVHHLYVGDASLFPSSSKVNPQMTIMALATRIAEHLASGLS
jgi:choline dehydrogenase-like flavoprotein